VGRMHWGPTRHKICVGRVPHVPHGSGAYAWDVVYWSWSWRLLSLSWSWSCSYCLDLITDTPRISCPPIIALKIYCKKTKITATREAEAAETRLSCLWFLMPPTSRPKSEANNAVSRGVSLGGTGTYYRVHFSTRRRSVKRCKFRFPRFFLSYLGCL